MIPFRYIGGELVCEGDGVMAANKRAVILRVMGMHTRNAKDHACFDTGGLLLEFEDGDLQVWPYVNEDIRLLQRNVGGTKARV